MKAWAILLVALIAGAGAVTASLLIPRDEASRAGRTATSPETDEPGFTVIGGGKEKGGTEPGPSTGSPSDGTGHPKSQAADERRGRSTVAVTAGEFAESSDGEDQIEEELEAEEEEEEQKQEEEEQRQEEREDRARQREKDRNDNDNGND